MKNTIITKRRNLAHALWAVPAIQLISLPLHAQASPKATTTTTTEAPIMPMPCDEDGVSRWQLVNAVVTNANGSAGPTYIINQTNYVLEITVNGSNYMEVVTVDGVFTIPPATATTIVRGSTTRIGSFDTATNTVSINSCSLDPSSIGLACPDTPFSFELSCESESLTTMTMIGTTEFIYTYDRI